MPPKDYPHTPDGRYFVSKGRLWRTTNPALPDDVRRCDQTVDAGAAGRAQRQGRCGES